MTDFETFISWLEKANIPFNEIHEEKVSHIEVERGYIGFSSYLSFDASGKFIDISAYEG